MKASLKWRLFFWFGLLVLLGGLALSFVTFRFASQRFEQQIANYLKAVANSCAALLDPSALAKVSSQDDPALVEIRRLLIIVSENFDLSWVGLYRYNGRYLVHLADGEGNGDGWCYGYPILDVAPEIITAWKSGEPSFTPCYQDAYGTWISYFYPIKNASGSVVAILDISRNAEEVDDLKKGIITQTTKVTGLIILCTLLICFLVARFTTKPLELLSKTLREISCGNLQIRIPNLSRSLEIATFIDAFNSMLESLERSHDELQRRISELHALNEISNKINFASSTQDVLRVILEKLVVSLQSTRGSIMLFDEDKQALIVQVVWSTEGFENPASRIEIRSGEGIAGKAFQDKQVVLFNQIPEGLLKPYDQGISTSIKNILCVPLLTGQRAIGVINIVNRQTGEFGPDDISLATTMAAQAAMVLEKARLYELAITDGLTKLYVHRYFQLALDNELRRCRRYNSQFALILFDIDHFKKFNDTWGHQTGDLVLSHTARILKTSLRSVDIAARYGGEEFAVILPESDASSGLGVAERIRQAVEAYDFPGQQQTLKVTISLGVAGYPIHGEEKMDLIRKADIALYQSKKRGRNTATMYDPAFGTSPPQKF